MSVDVTEVGFDELMESSAVPVVLEFYATWCGNCRRIAPVLEALGEEFAPGVRLVKVNTDEAPQLVARFGVRSTPTLFVLADGQQVTSVIGAQPEPVLRGLFQTAAELSAHQLPRQAAVGTACDCGPECTTSAVATASWVPVEACTLPTADRPMRLAEFDKLFSSSLVSQQRENLQWLRLHLKGDAAVERATRELAAREAECCAFFEFHIQREDTEVILDIRVPADKAVVLDGLAAQAQAAGA